MRCRSTLNTMHLRENRTDPNLSHTDLFEAPHKRALTVKISHVQCLSEIPTKNGSRSSFATPYALAPLCRVVLLCFPTTEPGTAQAPRMTVGLGAEKTGVGEGGSSRDQGKRCCVLFRWRPVVVEYDWELSASSPPSPSVARMHCIGQPPRQVSRRNIEGPLWP